MTHLKFGDTIIALEGIQTVAWVRNGDYPLGFDGERFFDGVIVRYENGALIGILSGDLVDQESRDKLKKEHGFTGDGCEVMSKELSQALWDQSEDATINAINQINEALKQTE